MPERRGFRFALEVVFLIALAAALSFAQLRPVVIAALMLLGWVIVALFEWLAWRTRPHYGRGLPPRYYVPQTSLWPLAPADRDWGGYPEPEHHEDASTWVASPSVRAELVGGWPVAIEPEPEFDPIVLLAPHVEAPEDGDPRLGLPAVAEARFEQHRIDPLRPTERKRFRSRAGSGETGEIAIVSARPEGLRPLPTRPTAKMPE